MALKCVKRLEQIEKDLTPKTLVDVGFPVFVENTPVRSGNARSHTYKRNDEIDAKYPYAVRLNQGWSRQRPKGMVEPTVKAVRDYVAKMLRK